MKIIAYYDYKSVSNFQNIKNPVMCTEKHIPCYNEVVHIY